LTVTLLAMLLAAVQPNGGYFSDSMVTALGRCGHDADTRVGIAKLLTDHYASHLRAANEPALAGSKPETVRFLWLRTFHSPVTVVIIDEGKSLRLRARRLSGQGGYVPGRIAAHIDRQLTSQEAASWRILSGRVDPWRLPNSNCEVALDGAQWIIEAAGPKGHTIADWQSPKSGPVREMGLFMLGLTGWKLDPNY
jgi:hypothetical protein